MAQKFNFVILQIKFDVNLKQSKLLVVFFPVSYVMALTVYVITITIITAMAMGEKSLCFYFLK